MEGPGDTSRAVRINVSEDSELAGSLKQRGAVDAAQGKQRRALALIADDGGGGGGDGGGLRPAGGLPARERRVGDGREGESVAGRLGGGGRYGRLAGVVRLRR